MNDYEERVCQAIRVYKAIHRLRDEDLGRILGISQESMNLRLNGRVPFKVSELLTLIEHGVDIPQLGSAA